MLLALFMTVFYYFFAAGLLFGYSIEGIKPAQKVYIRIRKEAKSLRKLHHHKAIASSW
jgi:hypothetical protein